MMRIDYVLGIIAILLIGCNNDDGTVVSDVDIISTSLNGSTFENDLSDIPLSGTIEVVFSKTVEVNALGGLISLSSSSVEADYNYFLASAGTRLVVSYSDLLPDESYTFMIQEGVVGDQGQRLNGSVTKTFMTLGGDEPKSPCTSATDNCLQSLIVNEGLSFDFYSTYDIISDQEYVWEQIEEVVFAIHGQNRNADDYFGFAVDAVSATEKLENTLVIAPYFKDESNAVEGELYWGSNWREGSDSSNGDASISSFTIMDELIDYLTNTAAFPNLKTIRISGHSSGAAFVQHYGIVGTSENSNPSYDFEYIVMNNQYFYYPDGRRYNESTNEFYVPTDCTGYEFWPYGYEVAPPYVSGMSEEVLLQQQINRKTIYLLGTNDTQTEGTLNTSDCAAVLLGSNRLERGRNMFLFFETYYTENNQEKIEVNGIGHDAAGMYSSDEFNALLTN